MQRECSSASSTHMVGSSVVLAKSTTAVMSMDKPLVSRAASAPGLMALRKGSDCIDSTAGSSKSSNMQKTSYINLSSMQAMSG